MRGDAERGRRGRGADGGRERRSGGRGRATTRDAAATATRDDARDDDASLDRRYGTYVAPEVALGDAAVRLPTPRRESRRDGAYKTVQATQRLTDGERETVRLFNNAKASVVYITNVAVRRDAFTLDLTEQPQGAGSGIVWDDKGHIVTNYHVIDKANQLKVSFLPNKGGVQNQKTYDAAIVGFDDDKDIAVLQVNDPAALREMKPLVIGTSGDSMVGQRVYAIGNPFGLDHTLTTGIISGLGREIQSGNTGRPIDGIIQTDAAINPGNSGGPLLNSSGQLIGINTAIYSASGTSSGVGFALPSDMVSGIVDQIIRYGRVTRPILGVSFAPDGALDQLGLGGVLVLDARAGGPAARAGVRSTTRDESGRLILGDIIIELAGEQIQDSSDLYRTLDKLSVGANRRRDAPARRRQSLRARHPRRRRGHETSDRVHDRDPAAHQEVSQLAVLGVLAVSLPRILSFFLSFFRALRAFALFFAPLRLRRVVPPPGSTRFCGKVLVVESSSRVRAARCPTRWPRAAGDPARARRRPRRSAPRAPDGATCARSRAT